MREKQLRPVEVPIRFDRKVEQEILAFLFEVLFNPILESMESTRETYFNSTSAIEDAIRSGRLQFADGIFKGSFNATLTKEFRKLGLKKDQRINGYRIQVGNLPIPLQIAISQTASNYQKMATSMLSAIDNLKFDEQLGGLSFASTYGEVIDDVNVGLNKTVNKVLGISVELTDAQRQVITQQFSENLKLFVKDFAESQIISLRKDVEKAVFAGIRAESLQDVIKDRFKVSESKAKFLAKQEISLLTAKYKQSKYQEVGINRYKWSTSQDSRVREDHKELNGKIFSFDDPPITNKDTGARNNPGEDFGCRCKPIPIAEI
jgi:SPP1 gp7 family putative phage head morphogenesis protein